MARKLYWLVIASLVVSAGYLVMRYTGTVPGSTSATPSVASLPPLPTKTPEELHGEWKSRVTAILATYDADKKADVARDQLELVRVGAEDRGAHFELFLAFRAVAASEAGADAKLTAAREAFKKR